MKETLQELRKGFFFFYHFAIRMITVVIAVIIMGFSISWIILVDMGTDPCSLLNIAISDTLGMTLGNWQALFNTILFVVVILCGARNIGFGTIANMFLVGYSIDFFSWIWSMVLPKGLFDILAVRIAVMVPALAVFILVVAVYIDMDMGTSPFDAIPAIIAKRLPKVPFKVVRIAYDGVATFIGFLFGGVPGVVTIIMVFALGPVIAWVGKKIRKKWDFLDEEMTK